MPMHFAYGCSLSHKIISAVCPGARFISRATLAGHRLCFPRFCSHWQGGVPSAVPARGSEVEGAIYRISAEDMAVLDEYEGVYRGEQVRREVLAASPEGINMSAWAYFATPQGEGSFAPAGAYLRAMIQGAREHRLSAGYTAFLESLLIDRTLNP